MAISVCLLLGVAPVRQAPPIPPEQAVGQTVAALTRPEPTSAEESIARYTFWLTILTGFMAVVAAFQGWASNEQRRIADGQEKLLQRQMLAQLRPRLVLRRIIYAKPDENYFTQLYIELADIGHEHARIKRAKIAVFPTNHQRERTPWRLFAALENAAETTPKSGRQGDSVLLVKPIPHESVREFQMCEFLYCLGYIEYADSGNIFSYRLGFAQRADPRECVFRSADHPDFEYAD